MKVTVIIFVVIVGAAVSISSFGAVLQKPTAHESEKK
jgi:hypothetical protein